MVQTLKTSTGDQRRSTKSVGMILFLGAAMGWTLIGRLSTVTVAEEPTEKEAKSAPFNLPTKTMGGIQFWTDQRVHYDWRIQKNVLTGHSRLLDPRDVRRCWGTYEQCETELLSRLKATKAEPVPEHVVLMLHGLMGSRPLLEPLRDHLREQGLATMCVSYASTRDSIDEHAQSLATVIQRLGPQVKRIDFVGHSMGNIVLRRYLGMTKVGSPQQKQIGRIVMLAPPNQGAEFARMLKDNGMFQLITGDSGQQLAHFDQLRTKLATPWTPFGIVAGSGSKLNPAIDGDNDLLVAIEETKLPGAADFTIVESMHRTLPKAPEVLQATHTFLTKGYFTTPSDRKPLPALPKYAPANSPASILPDSPKLPDDGR